jgi:excisionase family DNA binding protein
MTTTEAARYLGVRVQTLAVWRCERRYPELRYIKVGMAVKYRKEDLDRWLELRTVGCVRD